MGLSEEQRVRNVGSRLAKDLPVRDALVIIKAVDLLTDVLLGKYGPEIKEKIIRKYGQQVVEVILPFGILT